jgi:DNA-binding response OmpR family regulator
VAIAPDDAPMFEPHGLKQGEPHPRILESEPMRVLVVEDEQKVANALREGLEGEKYDVVVERTGEGAFFRVTTETFDVILLDLGLPGRSGLEILTALRERGLKTPVLVLTARDSVQDRVLGLDGGADDYLVKPFAFAELVARIRRWCAAAVPPTRRGWRSATWTWTW